MIGPFAGANTSALSEALAISIGSLYQVSITTTGVSAGSITVSLGGVSPIQSISSNTTTIFGVDATSRTGEHHADKQL